MKKKMTVVGVLALAVAVTASQVGGTYAKYISQYGITDEARVAKWNFTGEVTSKTVDLFQQSYTNDNGTYVASSDAAKVIAPGTSGEYEFAVTGTAETNFKITNKTEIINNVKILGDNPATSEKETDYVLYDPLRFSVNGTDWMTSDEFNTEVAKGNGETVYAANTDASANGKIYWMWAFDSKANNGSHIVDELDTKLAEDVKTKGYNIKATITTTVEQTDEAATPATVKPATVSNIISAEDAKELAENWGYQAAKAKDVFFNGNELTGTIHKTTNPQAGVVMGSHSNTGYYYAVNIKVAEGQTITYYGKNSDGSTKTSTWTKTADNGDFTIMLSLNKDAKETPIKYLVDGKEYQISYANLVFAE